MTDKKLKELQDIIHDAFLLQSRMNAWRCHIVSGGEDGVTLETATRQYPPLKDIRVHIAAAISGMCEIRDEMKRREGK